MFALPPIVWVGRVSYGIYLFHFPIFQWIQHERWTSKPKEYAVEYALTAAIVTVSWFLVERPALRLKNRRARPEPITMALGPAPDTV
jgi:peptidoglycan/LPS O-acetylase OafA/YrhL